MEKKVKITDDQLTVILAQLFAADKEVAKQRSEHFQRVPVPLSLRTRANIDARTIHRFQWRMSRRPI